MLIMSKEKIVDKSIRKMLATWAKNMLNPDVSDKERQAQVQKDYAETVELNKKE